MSLLSAYVSSVAVVTSDARCLFCRQISLQSPDACRQLFLLSPDVSSDVRCLFCRQLSLMSSFSLMGSPTFPRWPILLIKLNLFPASDARCLFGRASHLFTLSDLFKSFHYLPPPAPPYPSGLLNTIPSIYLSVSLSLSFCLLFLSLILPLFSYLSFFSSFCFFFFLDPFSFSVCLSLYSSYINISLYLPVSLSLSIFFPY